MKGTMSSAAGTAHWLLDPAQIRRVDEAAVELGSSVERLMQAAGSAVARAAREMAPNGPIACLAGPGNNGGDAYAAAVLLRGEERVVRLFALSAAPQTAETTIMAGEWGTPPEKPSAFDPSDFALVVDGLFGGGLSRPLEGEAATLIARLNESLTPVLAIDLPSGISGHSGAVCGVAVRAERTITFVRRKPGHLLQPGRSLSGVVEVADIGIGMDFLQDITPTVFANEPALFAPDLLASADTHHKYDRGHAVVFSGPATGTGAARLAARAALRGGAGLVTIFSPPSALLVNANHLTAIMLRRCADAAELGEHLADRRLSTFVLGPGFGDREKAKTYALALLAADRSLVLDADGLTAFADTPDELFASIRSHGGRCVMTPHDGEFARLFPDLAELGSKLERAREAAARAQATIVLKGSDTVIATPDGRAAINANAPSNLATAGSGDVLAGLVAAQLANGVPPFEAAAAAVWIHAKAAGGFGPGLIAEDLPDLVPSALRVLAEA